MSRDFVHRILDVLTSATGVRARILEIVPAPIRQRSH
jgi:hypothetical protein